MTGSELWAQYQHYTRDVTEHSRKLGFAGAAICWFFKDASLRFPTIILWALLFIVIYFVVDLLQALIGALVVKQFTESKEKELWDATGSISGEFDKPRWVDAPAFIAFLAKCVALALGFVFIGFELVTRIVQ